MKALLDTTYLLPAIGVSIKGVPVDVLGRLIARGDEILVGDVNLFELAAKGARYVFEGELSPERVTKGINAIVHDESITRCSSYDTPTLHLAIGLRHLLGDFIGCLVLSSAATRAEVLLTEDDEIHKLEERSEFRELMAAAGSTWRIKRAAEVL